MQWTEPAGKLRVVESRRGAGSATDRHHVMPRYASILLAVVLLGVAAFCVFGFLATYERPGWSVLRVTYGVVGLLALVGAGVLILRSRGGPSRGFPIEPRGHRRDA